VNHPVSMNTGFLVFIYLGVVLVIGGLFVIAYYLSVIAEALDRRGKL
jgi:hypothetical protein